MCGLILAASTLIAATPTLSAQNQLPTKPFSVLFLSAQTVTLDSYEPCSTQVETFSRITYYATSADWLSVNVDDDGELNIEATTANLSDGQRTATIELLDSKNNSSTITVIQPGFELGAKATDPRQYATVVGATASSYQGGGEIKYSYDDNTSTIYHSNWNGFDSTDSSQWPSLVYNFEGIHDFTNIYYFPRTDGSINGNFKEFEVLMKRSGDDDYVSVGTYNNNGESSAKVIAVPEAFREKVLSVKFIVHSGGGDSGTNFASCSEMKFEGQDMVCIKHTPTSATASSVQGNDTRIELSYDDNTDTYYHSNWSTSGGFDSSNSSEWPELVYNFADPIDTLDIIKYIPRTGTASGTENGRFKVVEILIQQSGSDTYTSLGTFDFQGASTPSLVYVPAAYQTNVTSVKFIVHSSASSGSKNYACVAEMQFLSLEPDSDSDSGDGSTATKTWDEEVAATFSDAMLTSLKPGITDEEIAAIQNPFLRQLAELMKSGEYSSEGKITSHEAIKNYTTLADEWSTPGKYYSQIEGVTGDMISKGQYVVMVEGLDDTKSAVTMRCIGWTVEDLGDFKNFFKSESYSLINGVNIINKTTDWDGLCYICNYNDAGAAEEVPPTVKVHIVGAKVNGIISNHKTNAENQATLDNACYTTIDCLGDKVQSVWEVNALKTYAKDQYVRYVNVLDILSAWEHRLLGFEKYDMLPKNHTLAYVNYDYYMYQGGNGVTFKYDTQYRVCSPQRIMYEDDDVVWGLSHEWGHQHQMHPYFCWGGLNETSNNMNSCYNVLHMGYTGQRVLDAWSAVRNHFLDESNTDKYTKYSSKRHYATEDAATAFSWCDKIKEFAAAQDSTITALGTRQAVQINEVGVEETLAPFFMLHCYFAEPQTADMRSSDDYYPDFTQDLYESLRKTAKHTIAEMNKYELLARAQNGDSEAYAAFVEKYPTSVWVTNGYITSSSNQYQNTLPFILNYMVKASELCKYNLYPFFEKMGSLRNVAIQIGDYGTYYYVMMEDMFQEIIDDMADMATKNSWKTMTDDLVNKIVNADIPQFETPNIPNDRPLTSDDLNSTAKTTTEQ
jgi:hypothetical protein